MKKIILLLLFIWLQISNVTSQTLAPQVLGSGGASNDSSAVKIAYTIGQTIAATGGSGSGILTQGFHQSNLPLLANLPCYELDSIPAQTVFQGTEKAFYVCVGSTATVSMEVQAPAPAGTIAFNPITRRFTFTPSSADKGIYEVIFRAVLDKDTAYQSVPFIVVPAFPPEQTAFGLTPVVPVPADDDDGFVVVTKTKGPSEYFNHTQKETYSISIAGKALVFDKQLANKLNIYCVNPRRDLKELNLYAETVIIRCALKLPQTNVTIHARTLVFEDKGEIASINTQPEAPTQQQGNVNGLQAGSVTLHLRQMSGDFAHRFRLIGGTGQGTGNGGNGGILSSNLDLKPFLDAPGGAAGDKGVRGAAGGFQYIAKHYSWLHPYALRVVINHTKIAYLNGHLGYTRKVADDYAQQVNEYRSSAEWGVDVEENQAELAQLGDEMDGLSERIANNRDYFGNPAGWAPMLSFEVNKIAFEEEIDKAIRVLYFCYWLQRIDAKNEQKISALVSARKQQEALLMSFQEEYAKAVALLPSLEAQADAVSGEIDVIQSDLAKLERELLERAKYVVEERHKPSKWSLLRKIGSTVGAIAQVVPLYQPAMGAIGAGLQTISTLDFSNPKKAIKSMYNVAKDISKIDFSKSSDSLSNVIKSLDFTKISGGKDLLRFAGDVGKHVGPLIDTLADLRKKTGETKAPQEEIQVELDKMRAESPEFTDLTNRVNDLMMEKLQFQQQIATTLQTISKLANDIQAGLVTIDGINMQAFNTSSKRDLRAMIYVKDMENRAKERLTRYHYNMAKAYEYRLLQPYTSELNLTGLFDRFKSIAETKGDDVDLTAEDFQNLRQVYDEVLSTVTANILQKYNNNPPEISTPVSFYLTPEDLTQLNQGQPVQLNMVERGLIQPFEEAPRIREFKVESIKMHVENGQPGSFAYFDIVMEHSGLSKLKKDGQVYFFNHYNNQNTNPISWSARYDVKDGSITAKQPSPSVASLLKSILDKLGKLSNENLELYSRPAAWADIIITKNDNSSNGIKMVIDELRFKVVYDFHQIPSGLVTIEVATNNELKPCIGLNKSDKNQRQDGWGSFLRTYFKNANSNVTLNAPSQYGVWAFEKWTDFFGNTISTSNVIPVGLGANKLVRANYKLIQPVLSLSRDTLYLPGEAGKETFEVQNIGTGTMNWSCSGSNDWLKFDSDTTGVNNRTVKISFSENKTGAPRSKNVIVVAASSVDYLDTLVIIQQLSGWVSVKPENEKGTIRMYPNPSSGTLFIDVPTEIVGGVVRVFATPGNLVFQQIISKEITQLELGSLSKGMYFIDVIGNGIKRTLRCLME